MAENPFFDLNWWADFIKTDEVIQNEMLTHAVCRLQGLAIDEYEAFSKLFLDRGKYRYTSGYNGSFDQRFLYPLQVGFEISVKQTAGRLELHTVDRLRYFDDKTVLIANANPEINWEQVCRNVLEDIQRDYPHIPAWHESLRINHFLEELNDPDDSE